MVPHFRQLVIKDIKRETSECVSLSFEIPEQWYEEFTFKPGQNLTIKMNMDGEDLRRTYSICSSPLDNELRIAIKKLESGKFSGHANLKLKKGDVLEVLPPTGTFLTALHPSQSKRYLAFAAGSGITPIISIIKTTLATEPFSTFTLVYGNRNRASIIFKEELEGLKNKYIERFCIYHLLSREKTEAPFNHGRITSEKCVELSRLINVTACDEFFICGPKEMIFDVKTFLEQRGVDNGNIHYELFTSPGQNADIKSAQLQHKDYENKKSQVTIKLDGISLDFELAYQAQSILDAALDEGLDLPYACKGGVCSSCRAKLTEGEVEMDVNYALEPEEMEAGFILTCQSHPRSNKIVVDFDTK